MSGDKDQAFEAPLSSFPARRALPPFAALRAFDAVARLGGVRKAAEALDLDHAVVSRHLRAIETWTGATLIERTRSGVSLSEDGLRYHRKIAVAIDTIAAATLDLMKQGDNSRLQIWCIPGFAFLWLMGRLSAFQAAHPGLDVELRPTDAGPDFGRHEADIDIRYAPTYGPPLPLAPNVRTVQIDTPAVIPLASPDYLARAPKIRRAEDFLDHPLIHEESFENWRAWLVGHGMTDVTEVAGQRFWQAHLTVEAARRGAGIVLANHFLARDDLASGRLVEVTGEEGPFERLTLGSYLLVARADRWNAPPVARFRHWMLGLVAGELAGS